MGACRNLRYDAAIGRVILELGEHDIGQDMAAALPVARDDGGGCLVTGGLDAENMGFGLFHRMGDGTGVCS